MRGVISGERTVSMFGWGAWVAIYITPPAPGADNYTVEVVSRKKLSGNVGSRAGRGRSSETCRTCSTGNQSGEAARPKVVSRVTCRPLPHGMQLWRHRLVSEVVILVRL